MPAPNVVRAAKRLTDLEIDEISLVDRGANQHARVAIAKRDTEDEMPQLFDQDGYEVAEDELEHGEVVTDDEGNSFVYLAEGTPEYDEAMEAGEEEDAYEDDDDFAEAVGKSASSFLRDAQRVPRAFARGRAAGGNVHSTRELRAARAGRGARRGAAAYTSRGKSALTGGASSVMAAGRGAPRDARLGYEAGRRGFSSATDPRSAAGRLGASVGRNRVAYAGAGGAVVGAGGGYEGRKRFGKRHEPSFGESILEDLSKALEASDTNSALESVAELVDVYKADTEAAWDLASSLAEERELDTCTEIAKSYGLPVEDEVMGQVLYAVSKSLPRDQVALLDRVFTAVGEQLYDQIGSDTGEDAGSTWGQVEALAKSYVGKSGGDLSEEQIVTAIFDANPAAYDDYLAEQGR